MTEEKARDILGYINEDNSLGPSYGHYVCWPVDDKIVLDSHFNVEEIEALA